VRWAGRHFIHGFLVLAQDAFWAGLEAENECLELGDPLKNRYHDLSQVAFWAGQKAGTYFAGPGNSLKHRILDFAEDAFWACQMAEGHVTTYRLRPSRVLFRPGGRKYI
jgi:hypothetical protein